MKPRKPIWRGDGDPVDVWLLQMDLANHSHWTAGLGSVPDAYVFRRSFALRMKREAHAFEFDRLSWGGDGGVFVADSRNPARKVVDAVLASAEGFARWREDVPNGDVLSLRVSAHRARITTADDAAYCYGEGLNDFMKNERRLADDSARPSLVITGLVHQELSATARRAWTALGTAPGTLGAMFTHRRVDPAATTTPAPDLEWMAGAWQTESSWGYVALKDGKPVFVYCHQGDDQHTGTYRDFTFDGRALAASFEWRDRPIVGRTLLKPNAKKDVLAGGWWYAEDLEAGVLPTLQTPRMNPVVWHKRPSKRLPPWAVKALK